MNVSFFDNRRVRQSLTVLLLAGSLVCIFPPNLPAFVWWADHAAFVAVGFLMAGLFFLIINKSRLMFVNEKVHQTNPAHPYSKQVDTPSQNRILPMPEPTKSTPADASSKTNK
jgi:hypothetical protein